MLRWSSSGEMLLVVRSHRILHPSIRICVWHGYIPIPIRHMWCGSRRSCDGVRMCTHSTLILLVSESSRRLCLRVAVVISCHLRLIWWGISVIPSRRARGIRVRLLPLIHGESQCLRRFRWDVWSSSSQSSCARYAKPREHESVAPVIRSLSKSPVNGKGVARNKEPHSRGRWSPKKSRSGVNDAWWEGQSKDEVDVLAGKVR